MAKRKICVVVASRANYGRVKSVMRAIQNHNDLELQLIVGASTLLYRFGKAVDIIVGDGFVPQRSLFYILEGENLLTQAKSTGIGISELTTAFADLKPDVVMSVADRFETMATAIAATYMNIPLAHIQGGEVSGNIDDRVRHAITKLADVHFPATLQSRERLIRMGEDASTVHHVGCPSIDLIANTELPISNEIMAGYGGTGSELNWSEPYVLLVQHPVTTSFGQGFSQIQESLAATERMGLQTVVLWPNIDAGTDDVSKAIRIFRERNPAAPFHYFRNFSPEDYARVLKNAVCAVGNSSSFLREGAFLGTPAVIVGDRQIGREHGCNIKFATYDRNGISEVMRRQIEHGRYPPDPLFGDGSAGIRIADTLAVSDFPLIKRMTY
jgi:UDP-hydrolysing UDP-N-acetyl-D-glucosamine 2-epimerase